jgi:O-antigen/teichoic acid export membrane protein
MSETAQALLDSQTTRKCLPKGRFSSRRAYAQTMTASVIIRGLGAVSGVLAARLLGPAGRGELAMIIFLPMVLAPLGELELPRSLAYEASSAYGVPDHVISTGFWLALALGCLEALVLAVILPIFLPADKLHLLPAAKYFVVYLPAVLLTVSLTGIDQGRGRFGRFSFFQTLPGAVYVLAILGIWYMGAISPQSFALGILAGALLTLAMRVTTDWRVLVRVAPDRTTAKRLLRRGFAFYLPAIAGYLLLRVDMLLAVRVLPTAAIGLYAVAQAIAVGQIGAVAPFVQVGFAAVASETEHGQALETLARHFRLAQLVVVAVGTAAAILTPWAIRSLFGARFLGATVATFCLIGAMVSCGMAQVLDQGLRAASHTRPGIFSNFMGLAALIGLGIPGCAHYGIDGLAAAVLTAQFVNLTTLIAFCMIQLQMPKRHFWAFDVGTFRHLKAAARF